MPRWLPVAVLLLLLAVDLRAEGIKLQDVPAKCPLCRTSFVAYAVADPGKSAGMDTDFFMRSMGEPPENYGVWMCPSCWFCAAPADFEHALLDELRKPLTEMLAGLKKARPESMPEAPESQRKIPAWFKWKVALACYDLRKATLPNAEAYLGDVCLRGSWVTRVSGNPIEHSKRVAAIYQSVMSQFKERNQKELAKQEQDKLENVPLYRWYQSLGDLMAKDLARQDNVFLPNERPIAQLMAGAFYRESGDDVQARGFLEQVIQANKPEQEEERTIAKHELELLEIEREFQTQAVAHYRKAYDSGALKGTDHERQCLDLIAELNRRLGVK